MESKVKIFLAFILNLIFSVFELVGGALTGSVAILSDALHDFGDSLSIGLSYFLERKSEKKPNATYTFGYKRLSVLSGLITTLILLIGSSVVIYNAINKIISPAPIDYNGMIIFAIVGVVVNGLAVLFTKGGRSLNARAVSLHMIEDVLGWLVVLIGAIIIRFTNFILVDPILSILVSLFVIFNSIKGLIEIMNVITERTPKNINVGEIEQHVLQIDGVLDVHHIHVWSLDGEINLATMHVVVKEYGRRIKTLIKSQLKEHAISHVTIEFELDGEECLQKECVIERSSLHAHCHHHH